MASKSGRIGLRDVDALAPGSEIWDSGKGAVRGFGVRRQKGEGRSYILLYRTKEGRQRRLTIGRHGAPWTPDTARREAQRLLGLVAAGGDPAGEKREAREAETVAELCARYLQAAEAGRLLTRRGGTKKASTLREDRSRIAAHVIPLLGRRSVRSLTQRDLETFLHDVAGGKTQKRVKLDKPRAVSAVRGGMGVASRTLGMLGAILEYGVKIGLRPDNPARGLIRPADGRRERRLSADEYAALAKGLERAMDPERTTPRGVKARGAMWPHGVAAVRFASLSGWRAGEVRNLRWRDVDRDRRTARLPDTKSGPSVRALSRPAVAVLEAQLRATGGEPGNLVFPPARGGEGATLELKAFVEGVVALAGLPKDITPHVLRHSYATVAASLGLSEITIAALLGHKGRSVTSRYVHFADNMLLAAADTVAGEILRQMGEAPEGGAPREPVTTP
jgi:integrase